MHILYKHTSTPHTTSVSSPSLEAGGLKFWIQTQGYAAEQSWWGCASFAWPSLEEKLLISQLLDENLKIWLATFLASNWGVYYKNCGIAEVAYNTVQQLPIAWLAMSKEQFKLQLNEFLIAD